jgi:hypothetical protein
MEPVMMVETIMEGVERVELSSQLLESIIAGYCKHYDVPPSTFDGALRAFALKAVADVAMASQLAAMVNEKVDFEEVLSRMSFGEQEAELVLLQKRMLEDYREPMVLTVPRSVYDRRFAQLEKWARRGSDA